MKPKSSNSRRFWQFMFSANSDDRTRYQPVAAITACSVGLRSSLPWQASIEMAHFSQPEQIGALFVGFQNDLYEPQNASGNLISRRINGLIR